MIAPHVAAAAAAPLRQRPSLLEAEIQATTEADRHWLFASALRQWHRDDPRQSELAL